MPMEIKSTVEKEITPDLVITALEREIKEHQQISAKIEAQIQSLEASMMTLLAAQKRSREEM